MKLQNDCMCYKREITLPVMYCSKCSASAMILSSKIACSKQNLMLRNASLKRIQLLFLVRYVKFDLYWNQSSNKKVNNRGYVVMSIHFVSFRHISCFIVHCLLNLNFRRLSKDLPSFVF